MALYTPSKTPRPLWSFVILSFLAISLTFLIVATSLHNLYSASINEYVPANGTEPAVSVSGTANIGAFLVCGDIDVSAGGDQINVHDCPTIPSNCIGQVAYTFNGEPGEDELDLGMNCTRFNAFRAFLVIAVIVTGFALASCVMCLLNDAWPRAWFGVSVGLLVLQLISLIIAWSLVAAEINNIDPEGTFFTKGPAFGLAVTAWVLSFVALALLVVNRVLLTKGGSDVQMKKFTDERTTDSTEMAV